MLENKKSSIVIKSDAGFIRGSIAMTLAHMGAPILKPLDIASEEAIKSPSLLEECMKRLAEKSTNHALDSWEYYKSLHKPSSVPDECLDGWINKPSDMFEESMSNRSDMYNDKPEIITIGREVPKELYRRRSPELFIEPKASGFKYRSETDYVYPQRSGIDEKRHIIDFLYSMPVEELKKLVNFRDINGNSTPCNKREAEKIEYFRKSGTGTIRMEVDTTQISYTTKFKNNY